MNQNLADLIGYQNQMAAYAQQHNARVQQGYPQGYAPQMQQGGYDVMGQSLIVNPGMAGMATLNGLNAVNALNGPGCFQDNIVAIQQPVAAVARTELLGFGQNCVGPCDTVDITAQPQVTFQAYSLFIPPQVAPNFLIINITFGKWLLFTSSGAVPADFFTNSVSCNYFSGRTVAPSSQVTITVQNISNTDQNFTAVMTGCALEDC